MIILDIKFNCYLKTQALAPFVFVNYTQTFLYRPYITRDHRNGSFNLSFIIEYLKIENLYECHDGLQYFYSLLRKRNFFEMIRAPKLSVQTLTGKINEVNIKDMQSRVNALRSRKSANHHDINKTMNVQEGQMKRQTMDDMETDQISTNFNPNKTMVPNYQTPNKTFTRMSKPSETRSIQYSSTQMQRQRPLTSYRRSFKVSKPITKQPLITGQAHALIFKQQIEQFKNLYQHLADILSLIKEGNIEIIQESIKQYIDYIQSKKISFIDDFIQGKERKLQKVIKDARLNESLSIAYLFLEMAQSRIENHQSYLTNFIGYCLSNVLLMARIYIIKEGKADFQMSKFQMAMKQVEIGSFGNSLKSFQDVALRLQHNNEIISMMHKKLGRFNPKFETCIQLFFKNAERKKTSCIQSTYYIFQYLALHIHETELVGISRTLQIAPVPYCPPNIKEYTLILEPLGILVHQNRTRPYLFQFLQWAHKYFDIILWTWQMPYESSVEKIYSKLSDYLISKLYRYHCKYQNEIWIKDLSRLGRNLDKVIIVDYDKRIYQQQPKNGVQLRWRSSSKVKDKGLLFLCQILQEMVTSQSIVEETLTIYAEQLYNIKGF